MRTDRRGLHHSLLLLLAAVIWGFAFVAQRAGMEHVGPFTFNALRFLLGSLSLLPVWLLTRRRVRRTGNAWHADDPPACPGLLLVGGVLFVAATLQQVGLLYTTAGKAGFITGLYVVVIPVLGLLFRQRVRGTVWVGAVAAVGGLYLLTGSEAGRIGLGDGLLLAGAFAWAVHVQLVGWLACRIDPIRIAVFQTSVCGLLSLVVALATESLALAGLRAAVPALLFAGILSVGIAYTLQIVGQRKVDPSRAGILVSLEAVFAVFGGWAFLGERVTSVMLIGCALMLAGMILSQLRRPDRLRDSAKA